MTPQRSLGPAPGPPETRVMTSSKISRRAGLVTALPEPFEKARLRENTSHVAHDRLYDDGG